MFTLVFPPCDKSWLLRLGRGALALCFSLLLIGLATPLAFAGTHAQSAGAANPQGVLQNVIPLGLAGPGGVAMVDQKVGWTLTSTLQRTSDKGKTWQVVARSTDQEILEHAYVLNGKVLWYQTIDAQTFAAAALYRTNDGGQTWTRFAWIDPDQTLDNVSIDNNQSSWISTIDSNNISHLFLVGGASQDWQEVTLPVQSGANDAHFISQKVGWTTVATEPDENANNVSTLYMTRDGGQTWAQTSLPVPTDVPATAITTNIRFLGFGNKQEGYLQATFGDASSFTIYNSYIYQTLDGGQTWQVDGSAIPANSHVIQVNGWRVVNSFFAFISVGGQVGLASLQAGSWDVENITFPENLNSTPFLTVLSPQLLFVSAESSDHASQILYRSNNGSGTWKQIATIPN